VFKLVIGLLYSCIFSDFHSKYRGVCYTSVSLKQVPTIAQKRNIFVLRQEGRYKILFSFPFSLVFVFIRSMQVSLYYLCTPIIPNIWFSKSLSLGLQP
jgi:hypothetical protein